MQIDRRFAFSGHAIGASAHFHRLDDHKNLSHVIPTLGSSAIPIAGGRSHQVVKNQTFSADEPRKRNLLTAEHAEALAIGRAVDDSNYETEIGAIVRGLHILDGFHVDVVELHQTSTVSENDHHSSVRTSGCKIEGLRLGNVAVHITLDEKPFSTCGTKDELEAFYNRQSEEWRRENCWRFHAEDGASLTERNGRFFGSLVKDIVFKGPADEVKNMERDGYSIHWHGFGRIFLGEVIISEKDRRVTMIRLKMGSDAAGFGSIGDGQTNSGLVP